MCATRICTYNMYVLYLYSENISNSGAAQTFVFYTVVNDSTVDINDIKKKNTHCNFINIARISYF